MADSLGAGVERLTNDEAVERYPSWDPTRERIVYAKQTDPLWDLYSMDVESRTETRLTFEGIYVGHPAWSPYGRRVAFGGEGDSGN